MNICMMSLMLADQPIHEILAVASACGMGAIDWIGLHGTTAKALKAASDDAGIPIAAHTLFRPDGLYGDPEDMDTFRAALDAACEMAAPVLMVPPFATRNQISPENDRKRYIDFYGRAMELAQKTPVQLTMESTGFLNSPITSAAECLEVLRAVPGLKLTFDFGNAATVEDPVQSFLQLRSYIVHWHLKDWYISDLPFENSDRKRCGGYFADAMIGDGDMPISRFWSILTPEEKNLWVNPETRDYTGKMPPLEAFQEICRRLRAM